MNFAVRPTLSQDGTKIVLVALDPYPYAGVWATVACEDIREEFELPDVPNDLLLERAKIRQTNTDALGDIVNSLFKPGEQTVFQRIHVIEITRLDLAGRKEYFAWGYSDLPPILGISDENSTQAIVEKFEREKYRVESFIRLLGWTDFALLNPNLRDETGLDVIVERDGKRYGFQVTDFHSDEGSNPADGGSALRRQERKRAREGLPAAFFANPDPIPALVRRIRAKSTKVWSRKDFPEVYLLIAASTPELPWGRFDVPLGPESRYQQIEFQSKSRTC